MELRHLRYFVAVAEELHFRRAAARLHVAQPAISEQVRKLEVELGVELLRRTPRCVELTPAGAVLLEDARRILRQADAARHAVQRVRERAPRRLRLGYVPDALPACVPGALAAVRAGTPAPLVELETGRALALLADVRADRLDGAVVSLPLALGSLRAVEIAHERAVAAIAAGPAGDDRPVTLALLARRRVLLMPRAVNPAFHDAVVGAFRAAELAPCLVAASEPSVEHIMLEVAAGQGAALLPGSVAERVAVPGVGLRPLAGNAPGCTLALVVRDEAPAPPLAAFLRALAAARQGEGAERARALAAA
jgi:DNA-binding transcriptional LysR family regulator